MLSGSKPTESQSSEIYWSFQVKFNIISECFCYCQCPKTFKFRKIIVDVLIEVMVITSISETYEDFKKEEVREPSWEREGLTLLKQLQKQDRSKSEKIFIFEIIYLLIIKRSVITLLNVRISLPNDKYWVLLFNYQLFNLRLS